MPCVFPMCGKLRDAAFGAAGTVEERIIELQRWKRKLVEKVVRASDGQDAAGDAAGAGGKGGAGAVDPDPNPIPDSASEGGATAAYDTTTGARGPHKPYPNPGLGTPAVKLTREDMLVLLRPQRRPPRALRAIPDSDHQGSGGATATDPNDARPSLSR